MDGDLSYQKARGGLKGARVRLVPFSRRHLEDPNYLGWLRDHEVVRTLNLPQYLEAPISFSAVEDYCRKIMQSPTDRFYAIERNEPGDFIGTLKVGTINTYAGTADIGIMIGRRDLWARGLATDAVAVACRYLFAIDGMRRLTAGMMANNPAMIRVFEKLGFQREGCFRLHDRVDDDYVDHIHLACFKDEFVAVCTEQGIG